jgi:hypothetical protein
MTLHKGQYVGYARRGWRKRVLLPLADLAATVVEPLVAEVVVADLPFLLVVLLRAGEPEG